MTWKLNGTRHDLHRDGAFVDSLQWEFGQGVYVDAKGAPVSRNFKEACAIIEARAEKRRKAS